MSGSRVALLAEDETDCDAVGELVRRIASDVGNPRVGVKKYWGNGCSRLRKKAEQKMKLMAADGCAAAILVHDLDRNDEATLRAELAQIEVPAGLWRHICIPVEELEAWFWSDPKVVQIVGRGEGKDHPSPHLIKSPKEALIRLSRGAGKKPRYSTNDNPNLAKELDLALCAKRCPAFRDLAHFVRDVFSTETPGLQGRSGGVATPGAGA